MTAAQSELIAAIEFLDRVKAASADEQIAARDDAFTRLEIAARAVAAECARVWKPIETAPKDGRMFLVGRPGFCPEVVWWQRWIPGFDWPWFRPMPDEDPMRLEPTVWTELPEY